MKLVFNIPGTWNELSDSQLKKVAKLCFSKLPSLFFDYALLKILLKIKWYKFRLRRRFLVLLKVMSLSEIKTHYKDFYETQNLTRFISSIKVNGINHFPPSDRLGNISIGEFSVLEDLYLGYLNTKDDSSKNYGYDYLLYIIAVLYTPDTNGTRAVFNKELLQKKAKAFQKVKKEIVYAGLLSYMGCRDYIASLPKYALIFPKPKSSPKKTPSSSGIGDLILSMSAGTFGDYDKTYHTNLYTFLDDYSKKLKASENEN